MHHQPIDGPGSPMDAPAPMSPEHEVQRWLLLELVTSPPIEGDDLDYLSERLEESRDDVEAAVEALVAVGLAVREGDRVRGTPAAWRFDALWRARS